MATDRYEVLPSRVKTVRNLGQKRFSDFVLAGSLRATCQLRKGGRRASTPKLNINKAVFGGALLSSSSYWVRSGFPSVTILVVVLIHVSNL